MTDTELQSKVTGTWNWCDAQGERVACILDLKRDGTYSLTITIMDKLTELFTIVIGEGYSGVWYAREYEKGQYKPHMELKAHNLKHPLLDLLGPLKSLVGLGIRIRSGTEILYIDEITENEILVGNSRLIRR